MLPLSNSWTLPEATLSLHLHLCLALCNSCKSPDYYLPYIWYSHFVNILFPSFGLDIIFCLNDIFSDNSSYQLDLIYIFPGILLIFTFLALALMFVHFSVSIPGFSVPVRKWFISLSFTNINLTLRTEPSIL
jgi:hypothetical protein